MLLDYIYILPMILGRTFNARDDTVGIDIFSQSVLDDIKIIEKAYTSSISKIVESSDTVSNVMGITGDLAVKIKAGKINLSGTGTYLKDKAIERQTIELLTRMNFETETRSLRPNPKPVENWHLFQPEDLGTHYVESITYGGELYASLKFIVHNKEQYNSVKGIVKANFDGGDAQNLVAEGNLEKVMEKLEGRASLQISYFSNVPLKVVPNTIKGLRDLVQNFRELTKRVNKGMGVPIRVILQDLSYLEGSEPRLVFKKKSELKVELQFFEMEFDDLRNSKAQLKLWYRSLPISIDPEQEKEINDLYQWINRVLDEYFEAIRNMDVEEDGQQLQQARISYWGENKSPPGKFAKELNKLMEKIVVNEKQLFSTGTGTYIRWGCNENCKTSSPMSSLSYGYMATTNKRGLGGGSQYLCLPEKPDEESESPSYGLDYATLSGVKYGLLDETVLVATKKEKYWDLGVPCTRYHVTNRTLIYTFPAVDKCPPGWITEYSGFLMSGSKQAGTHICVDEDPKISSNATDLPNVHAIEFVHVKPKSFLLKGYDANSVFKCSVCSK